MRRTHPTPLGQRVKKTVSQNGQSVSTHYLYDEAGQLLGEYTASGAPVMEVVYLDGQPVLALQGNGAIHSVHADHLNTPRALVNENGNTVWRWDSDAYGTTPAHEDPDCNGVSVTFNWRFPGQSFDADTGLHYNYFRDYDPVTGRYIESDPIGLRGGVNTYSYAAQSSLNLIDPKGLSVKWTGTVSMGGATAGLGGQMLRFSLISECKCGKRVRSDGFASFVTMGAGVNMKSLGRLSEASGNSGNVTLTDEYADCPSIGRSNGSAWIGGISLTVLAGGTLFPSLKLGNLRMSDWFDGPSYGLDVSITSTLYGHSAITNEVIESCCGE